MCPSAAAPIGWVEHMDADPHTQSAGAPERDSQLLKAVWERNRGEVHARVEVISDAVLALGQQPPAVPAIRDGALAAHTLAGSLGMFGFRGAEAAARELEETLGTPGADPERARAALARLRADLTADPLGGSGR